MNKLFNLALAKNIKNLWAPSKIFCLLAISSKAFLNGIHIPTEKERYNNPRLLFLLLHLIFIWDFRILFVNSSSCRLREKLEVIFQRIQLSDVSAFNVFHFVYDSNFCLTFQVRRSTKCVDGSYTGDREKFRIFQCTSMKFGVIFEWFAVQLRKGWAIIEKLGLSKVSRKISFLSRIWGKVGIILYRGTKMEGRELEPLKLAAFTIFHIYFT